MVVATPSHVFVPRVAEEVLPWEWPHIYMKGLNFKQPKDQSDSVDCTSTE